MPADADADADAVADAVTVAPTVPTPQTAQRLLELNRAFYAGSGAGFDALRQEIPGGMRRALELALPATPGALLRVLDVGCGNGRLARALAATGHTVDYTGLDADAGLLAAARRQTEALPATTRCSFVTGDLANARWDAALPPAGFDLVACLATLHHMPGLALRRRVVQQLAQLAKPGGRVVLSAWQYTDTPDLAGKLVPWSALGLSEGDVEPGDALVPWNAEPPALRYLHLIDAAAMQALGASAGLHPVADWRADGRTGSLALFALFERGSPARHLPISQGAAP